MPTISVKKRVLDKQLGASLSQDEVDQLCFLYGLELDDVVTERDEKSGAEEVVYKIEIPANRYDLLCVEGLARALLVFQKKIEVPRYQIQEDASAKEPWTLVIKPETAKVRPFAIGAILRGVRLDKDSYASFIDLQDKLHQNIGRRRALVAIGTHDLDKMAPARYVLYRALPPKEIVFKPLNQSREFDAVSMMEFFSTDSHLREYLPIIRDKEVYPVFYDASGVVLSMPPIINGDHTKITLGTTNIFIECTGTDLKKLEIVLDTLVTTFSQYCSTPYSIEPVQVVVQHGCRCVVDQYPVLKYREMRVSVSNMNKKIGVNFDPPQIIELLSKMGLSCEPVDGSNSELKQASRAIQITVPPTRHDILHECDVAEDLALAYGYNRILPSLTQAHTVAQALPLNKLTDQLRHELASAGWTEVLNFALCSTEDISTKLRKDKAELADVVKISNPKTLDFQVVRKRLLPGILKTLSHNKDLPLPLKLFEIQDVVYIDEEQDTKSRNERHLAAILYSKSGGFEIIHGLLDRIMEVLDVPLKAHGPTVPAYSITESNDSIFFEGRCGRIDYDGRRIGEFGIIHPEVLTNFSLPMPCSYLEMNIEPFL